MSFAVQAVHELHEAADALVVIPTHKLLAGGCTSVWCCPSTWQPCQMLVRQASLHSMQPLGSHKPPQTGMFNVAHETDMMLCCVLALCNFQGPVVR